MVTMAAVAAVAAVAAAVLMAQYIVALKGI